MQTSLNGIAKIIVVTGVAVELTAYVLTYFSKLLFCEARGHKQAN